MNPITYSLVNNGSNAGVYYSTVSSFADETMAKSALTLHPIISQFKQYLTVYQLEELREDEEYVLELLSFGVLWKTYAGTALAARMAPFISMAYLAEWRKKHLRWKPAIDAARGFLTTFFLLPNPKKKAVNPEPTLVNIDHVCKWFEATGEFREQAIRFIRWRAFWETKPAEELQKTFSTIRAFTAWFETRAVDCIGNYTTNVESFLMDAAERYRWREDRISCTRSRLEYHLNMVGAELMNRAFRKHYEQSESKVVLLPGCMRANSAEECNAQRTAEGLLCTGCSVACAVNRLREMGKRNGFEVYVIPHASDLSLWSPKEGAPLRGVVASACVTTLVEGGWELKRYNVPAQCVLLNCSGCKKHWRKDSVATALDVRELMKRLN